jgi:hypothetical protein
MPAVTSAERVPCRGCGFGVRPTAAFCLLCKAPDPALLARPDARSGLLEADGSPAPVPRRRPWAGRLAGVVRMVLRPFVVR